MKSILKLISLLMFLFPTYSWGCGIPYSGPKYDSLIKVEKVAKNKFKVSIPKEVGDLNFGVHVSVKYYLSGDEYRAGEYSKYIHAVDREDHYFAIFELKKIDEYIPFIQVFWLPESGGSCGAYGMSNDLILE